MRSPEVKVKEGDRVIVRQNPGRGQTRQWNAVVVAAARVWLVIKAFPEDNEGQPWKTWRMRRDQQSEPWDAKTPGGGMYQARFFTEEQWAQRQEHEQMVSVGRMLAKHGVSIDERKADEWPIERRRALAGWLERDWAEL
jgi:hypothetical protein